MVIKIRQRKNNNLVRGGATATLFNFFDVCLVLMHFDVFCVESPPPTQPEMIVYAGCLPLHLFEEDIFLLTRMVRFCVVRTGKHYLFCYQCFILLQKML